MNDRTGLDVEFRQQWASLWHAHAVDNYWVVVCPEHGDVTASPSLWHARRSKTRHYARWHRARRPA